MVDCSHLTLDVVDVHRVTTEATSPAIADSANIVLRDSYLIAGSLFCMVVRAQNNSFIPPAVRLEAGIDEGAFLPDISVPSGMSMSQCRSLFKQLVVKAKLGCRSFDVMTKLARVQVVVVILTQDLVDRGSVVALCASAKRLNRPVVLITGECRLDSSESLAKELGMEFHDLRSPGSTDTDGISTVAASASQSVSHSVTDFSSGSKTAVSGLSSPIWTSHATNLMLAQRPEIVSSETKTRLQTLVGQLSGKSCPGAVLHRPAQDTVNTLCMLLAEGGVPPLLAMGSVQFAGCFRSLVIGARYKSARSSLAANGSPSDGNRIHYPSTALGTPRDPPRWPSVTRQSSKTSQRGSNSLSPSGTIKWASQDPVQNSPAFIPKGAGLVARSCIELAISINSVGVVSDYSDCVMLTSDLGCLGQALELASKGVPPAAIAAAAAAAVHLPTCPHI